jgi:hypothetical protein
MPPHSWLPAAHTACISASYNAKALDTPLTTHGCHLPLLPLQCMVGKCGGQIFACMADSTCRTALNCLSACEFNDQVGG